jgi:phosphopantetheinyl transferase
MPLVYQQNINEATKIGLWHITESEFFFENVPQQKQIKHPQKRLQHLAGRFLLSQLFPNFPLSAVQISASQKPFLQSSNIHFSVSHCKQYAAAIVSTANPCGVDVEMVNDKIEKIIPKFLTQSEIDLIPHNQLKNAATLFWSVKETLFKWDGKGGIDFKKHLCINGFTGNLQSGFVNCSFKTTTNLQVNYFFLNDVFFTWVCK